MTTATPRLDPNKWLLKCLNNTSTAQLVEDFLTINLTGERRPRQSPREAVAENFVHEQILQAADHLDAEYGTVDLPQALACLELALSIEVLEGEFVPSGCSFAELLHRLLALELAQNEGASK